MSPFQKFVSAHVKLFQSGKKLSLPPAKKSTRKKFPAGASRAVIFSPHPDDECIVGGLALRLAREAGWKIINVAITFGSRHERRAARLRELENACRFLGFKLIADGFEKIDSKTIAKILIEQKPRVIFLPHRDDGHPTHIATHLLVLDALKKMPKNFNCFIVETEFWRQMASPNLLVESSINDVADLIAALSYHVGEVKRNPYHARLPAWMMDNVRRGAELIGRQGGAAPDFVFGTIYRLQKWRRGKFQKVLATGKFLVAKENPEKLFH